MKISRIKPALFIALSLLALAPRPARAADDPVAQAKVFFDVGAKAYTQGNYPAAIQAFEQAQRLSPRPTIVFSLAQAHRKQFYLDRRADGLRQAISLYREYITSAPDGGRRAEASQYITELEPALEKVSSQPDAPLGSASGAPVTRIMVSSPTEGALVALDGAPPKPAPLFVEAKPGNHTVLIAAPGYFDEPRSFDLKAGAVMAFDVPLRERPAKLAIETDGGAQVSLDGRYVATAPLAAPLELASGPHLLTITKNGHKLFSDEIDVERGESRAFAAPLDTTGQRITSYALLAAGAAGLVTGGVFLGLSGVEIGRAVDVLAAKTAGDADPALIVSYEDAKAARDDDRRVAFVAGGIGGVVGLVGALLFAFDQPSNAGKRPARRAPERAPAAAPTDVVFAPIVAPGMGGASLRARF